jgi:hypothetical protein
MLDSEARLERQRTPPVAVRALAPLLVLLLLAPIASAQSLTEAFQECPGTLTGSTMPEQIHLQTTENPADMVVVWATDGRTDGEVEWNGQNAMGESYCYNHDMAFHMATMTGLEPGQEVTYRVGDGSTWSEEMTFTTIDPNANRFEWIAIADHGMSDEGLQVSDAILADTTAQMVTISGDISYANGDQSMWDDYFDVNEPSMTTIPWMTAVGNHENEPGIEFEAYDHRFDADGAKEVEPHWYSRNLPGVHMVFMSTEHGYDAASAQFAWLEADLAAVDRKVTPFVVIIGHKPMYSSNSYHGSEVALRDALEALYIENEVDLVIAGHDHFYERTTPVVAEAVQGAGEAPVHLVIGIAGRSAYEDLDEPAPVWSAFRENSTYGWTRIIYDGDASTLTVTHHRIDGTIGDQFTLYESQPPEKEAKGFLPGFDPILPILAMFGAAVRRLR